MTEREVVSQCIDWLRSKGWICRRQHVGLFYTADGRPQRIGDAGEPDWRCIRATGGRLIEYFEFEAKAQGKKPRPEQREYIAKRRHQGFRATWADSLEMLQGWYAAEGYE